MQAKTFFCIDGHTCGNPVRLVAGGGPLLEGASMSARRQDFLERFDWIRTALMFEPRGHDVMSGAILYPPCRADCDTGILYIEVSGCLPMCGHGTIGAVTFALEQGLVSPRAEGEVRLDTPAGLVVAAYQRDGRYVERVRLTNVASYLALPEVRVDCPELGELVVDIAYGGNFYAIVEPQPNYAGLDSLSAGRHPAPQPRAAATPERAARGGPSRRSDHPWGLAHPVDRAGARRDGRTPATRCSTARPRSIAALAAPAPRRAWRSSPRAASSRSATSSSTRASSAACSRAGSRPRQQVGRHAAIVPSVAGWARMTGLNTIFVDPRDPYAHGFQLSRS